MRTGDAAKQTLVGKALRSIVCGTLFWGTLLYGAQPYAYGVDDLRVPAMPSALAAPVPGNDAMDGSQGSETPVLHFQTALEPVSKPAERPAVQTIQDIRFSQPREVKQSGYTSMRVPTTYRTKSWVAPRAVHRTLFFQDKPLERHGRTNHAKLQPAISVVRFFADAILYPARQLADVRHPVHYATSPR